VVVSGGDYYRDQSNFSGTYAYKVNLPISLVCAPQAIVGPHLAMGIWDWYVSALFQADFLK